MGYNQTFVDNKNRDDTKPSCSEDDYSGSSQNSGSTVFSKEPLYQIYAVTLAEEAGEEIYSTPYELVITDTANEKPSLVLGSEERIIAIQVGPESMLRRWSVRPQVISSGLLDKMTSEHILFHESKFELMTSEASYLKSLKLLDSHFIQSEYFKNNDVVSREEFNILFKNVPLVLKCSEKVLSELVDCWDKSVLMEGLFEKIHYLAQEHFSSYVTYCSHQPLVIETYETLVLLDSLYNLLDGPLRWIQGGSTKTLLQALRCPFRGEILPLHDEEFLLNAYGSNERGKCGAFKAALEILSSSPVCHKLPLYSFLTLPLQRVSRMFLLLQKLSCHLKEGDAEYEACCLAVQSVKKVIIECDESVGATKKLKEMARVCNTIHFPNSLPYLPLLSSSRSLVRSEELTHVKLDGKASVSKWFWQRDAKFTLFLFSDYLLITTKAKENSYTVNSYAQRKYTDMFEMEPVLNYKYLVELVMYENHDGKPRKMVLCCGSEESKKQWLNAFAPPKSGDPSEKVYPPWNLPEVKAMYTYTSSQPNDLSLNVGDVVLVEKKTDEGWSYGSNRQGDKGWFPSEYAEEIPSDHVKVRHLRQRHLLLHCSESYNNVKNPT